MSGTTYGFTVDGHSTKTDTPYCQSLQLMIQARRFRIDITQHESQEPGQFLGWHISHWWNGILWPRAVSFWKDEVIWATIWRQAPKCIRSNHRLPDYLFASVNILLVTVAVCHPNYFQSKDFIFLLKWLVISLTQHNKVSCHYLIGLESFWARV